MHLIVGSLLALVATGALVMGAARSPRQASIIAAVGVAVASALGIVPVIQVLMGAEALSLRVDMALPGGSWYISLDALSALFLVPIYALSTLAAVYGVEYLDHDQRFLRVKTHWAFYTLLVAGMVLVVVARNALLFLIAWEVMSVASFFLVTFNDDDDTARRAGRMYLVATHIGTAALLVMFVLLAGGAAVLDFNLFGTPTRPGWIFVLALIGFGTKAGIVPLHTWLPEAHPAAPSHVSAVMSGVMIKTGIYGILRIVILTGHVPVWWGVTLLSLGVTSGILGVLFALAQHDLKRLLAYSSVENIGIITIGMGLGLLGMSLGSPALTILGMSGALFHVINHAAFKGLLFLGAGAVHHRTGTLEMDRLGGLLRRMPVVGFTFLIGAVAITGLPPLNGFASEFLIYLGAVSGVTSSPAGNAVAGVTTVASLALIGGLAAACFTKVFGIVFLGVPRSDAVEGARPVGRPMKTAMVTLTIAVVALGLGAPLAIRTVLPAVAIVTGTAPAGVLAVAGDAGRTLLTVVIAGVLLVAVILLLRHLALRGRTVAPQPTWGCGYTRPTPRMQYTAASYAQPITDFFRIVLRSTHARHLPDDPFPTAASYHSHTPDVFAGSIFRPAAQRFTIALNRLRWVQHGRLHGYVMYIVVTFLALLLWNIRP